VQTSTSIGQQRGQDI